MIFAVPPTAIWETSNYLWNSDGQGTLTAWTYIITSYYPIQLWWSRYSALNGLGGGVGLLSQCAFVMMTGDQQVISLDDRRRAWLAAWTFNRLLHIAAVNFMSISLENVVKY